MTHTVFVVVAVIAVVGYVIGRQLLGEALRVKRVVVLPLVLAVVGLLDLGKDGRHPELRDVAFIAVSAAAAAAIGLAQGAMMRLELRDGGLWGRMPVKSLWLWGALIVSRLLIGAVAHASGAHVAASTAPILFVLGVNRLAQAAVIALRAVRSGIPFAGERNAAVGQSMNQPGPRDAAPLTASTTSADVWHETRQQILTGAGAILGERRHQRPRRGRAARSSGRERRRR